MPRKMTTVRTRVSTTSKRQPRAGRWVTRVGGSQDREYRGGFGAIASPQSGRELTPRNGPRYTPAALETGRESARGAPPATARNRSPAHPEPRPDDRMERRPARRRPEPAPAKRQQEDPLNPMDASLLQWIIPIAGIAAVLFAGYLARDILSRDKGPQAMQDVGDTIREGADAFVKRQYTTIGVLALVAAVVIGAVIGIVENKDVADVPALAGLQLGVLTGLAFLVGAGCSMLAGIIGMTISVRSNVRTAAAARRSLVEAVQVAMRGGAVSGFLVVSLSLLGVWGIFTLYQALFTDIGVAQAPFVIVGFGFGASFVALFAQLGGGIYTKAADVGSDLVGKVEAGIPEDDPRNAGVIADLVGDNVGD